MLFVLLLRSAETRGNIVKLYRFDASAGHPITQHGSDNVVMSGIQRTSDGAFQIGCMYIGTQGVVGRHQATTPQLFLVVEGAGWVRGDGPDGLDGARRHPITPGQAAFWEAGEWHESGSDFGMTAIVLEGDGIEPGQFMREEPLP
jgi:quercetin dioxygenase-like cupin family protein